MAICKKCGAELKEDEKICLKCGEPTEVQSDNQPEMQDDGKTEILESDKLEESSFPIETSESVAETENVPQTPNIDETTTNSEELDKLSSQHTGKLPRNIKKISIIAAICIAFLLICGFTAKTYFARDLKQLFLGENKYMQAVEKNTADAITNQAVTAFDSAMQELPFKGNNMAVDYQNTIHVDLDNNFKNQLQQLDGNAEVLKKTLDFINSTSIKGSTNQNGQLMQSSFSIADKSNKLLTVNMFIDKDGKYIYQMPELSKTYLISDNSAGISNPVIATSKLKYDSVKLKASLQALTQAYVDAVPNGKISVKKNQNLTVEGVTVTNAEKISVTLSAEQITQILKQMAETAKKDDYLYTFVSENYNTMAGTSGEKMDKTKYVELLDNYINELRSPKTFQELTVSAYILANDTQVARSYEITELNEGTPTKKSLNLIFTKKDKLNQMAANLIANDKEYFSVKTVYNSADSGVTQFSVKDPIENSNVGLKIEFSNLKKAKFLNREITLGKFNISLSDPNNTIKNSIGEEMGLYNEWANDLSKSTMTLENTMENDKLNSKFSLNLKGFANIQLNSVTTSKTSSEITMPSINEGNTLKIGSVENEVAQIELQQKYIKDSLNHFSDLLDKDKDFADLMQTFGINKEIVNSYQQQLQ